MPSPKTLLPWFLGGAVGLGGLLQGIHWRSTNAATDVTELENQLRIATEENEILKRENEALRSLAQGGGEVSVPQELVDRVEAEFGLRFLSSPVVHRIAGEELRDRIAASLESRFGPAGIDHREEAYKLVGWLRPHDRLLPQLTAIRSVGALGWFDEVSGENWVTDRFNLENIPDQAALIRLLTRTLLHQNFPPPPAYPGDDAARAREALHQGAASGSEARYLSANARSIGFMPMRENEEAAALLMSLSPFIHGITMFPVLDGKALADTLHVRGNDVLHEALRNPPQTTRAIFLPTAQRDALPPLALPELSEEPFLGESAGQLGLRLWLDEMGDVGLSQQIASAWVNDRYLLVPEGEDASALLWEIEFADADAADRFQELALELIAAAADAEDPAGLDEPVVTPEGRHLRISRRSPTRARFVNSAGVAGLPLVDND